MGRRSRRVVFLALALAVAGGAAAVATDRAIHRTTRDRVHRSVAEVPATEVALVLGTSRTVAGGRRNLFFDARIRAAAELFHAGKVDGVLVSGDHSRVDYDEPSAMKEELVRLGVPAGLVTRDHAGLRTLDSVVRARRVFGLSRVVIVSQAFHCERALFLADREGLAATALAADPIGGFFGAKVRVRETLARVKAVLDVVLGTEPRFLGPPVEVATRD